MAGDGGGGKGRRKLFAAFDFPGLPARESETPFSLPAPAAPGQRIVFNFRKVISVDKESGADRCVCSQRRYIV